MTNKEIIEKYPFLTLADWNGKPKWGYTELTALDDIPTGWRELVLQMAEDINKIPHGEDLYFVQIKEKYGSLRIYSANSNEEVEEIIDNYSFVSQFVCIGCGKPDVYFMDKVSWVSPFCEDCFNKFYKNMKYKNFHGYDSHICPNEYKTRRYSNNGYTEITHDIKDIIDRYRNGYVK